MHRPPDSLSTILNESQNGKVLLHRHPYRGVCLELKDMIAPATPLLQLLPTKSQPVQRLLGE